MPKSWPPIIRDYKHIRINAGYEPMLATGIYLNESDAYTILATGSMDLCPYGDCTYRNVEPGDRRRFKMKIGENHVFYPLVYGFNAHTSINHSSGYIYLGYRSGGNYENDTGSFSVDIIVWQKEDWVQIADFFEKMKEKDPNNEAIIDALGRASWQKEMYLAEAKASKEIEDTKKEIQVLKKETEKKKEDTVRTTSEEKTSPLIKPSADEAENLEKIAQLEESLAKLMESLTQLGEMKKKFEEEKKKTAQLSQELEEKDERERELLNRIEEGSKNPPVIVIAAPSDGQKTEGKIIQLSGVAEDDQGLERIEIFINNKLLSKKYERGVKIEGSGFPTRLNFSERLPLNKGENQIKIRAIDSEGLISEKVLTVYNIERRRNIWAVIIGINDYPNINKLKYAVNDAKAFYELLVVHNKIPAENVTLLLNQDANLTNLRSTLGTKLKKSAGKEDMVIIYFAGHGATERDAGSPDGDGLEKYLLPYNADLHDLYSTALPMREISHIFQRIRSESLIFIADSCYSGASGGRTVSFSGTRASISDGFLDRIASGKGTVIITASAANEVSVEDEQLQHGIFTYYLLEGLRGKADTDSDGLITVDEVYRYLYEQVTKATGQEQHPVKKGAVVGRLILGIVQ